MSEADGRPYALVVDDDPFILADAVSILEEFGFRTFDAPNGEEAVRLLKKVYTSVVLLFTDVQMPGAIDGFALARKVAIAWPDIAIVVSSGHVRPEPDQMPDGATFIAKPFSADVVRERLQVVLPDRKKPDPLKH